jgi:hypothetical protein
MPRMNRTVIAMGIRRALFLEIPDLSIQTWKRRLTRKDALITPATQYHGHGHANAEPTTNLVKTSTYIRCRTTPSPNALSMNFTERYSLRMHETAKETAPTHPVKTPSQPMLANRGAGKGKELFTAPLMGTT